MKSTKIIFVIILLVFVVGAFIYYQKNKDIIVPSDSGIIPAPSLEVMEEVL